MSRRSRVRTLSTPSPMAAIPPTPTLAALRPTSGRSVSGRTVSSSPSPPRSSSRDSHSSAASGSSGSGGLHRALRRQSASPAARPRTTSGGGGNTLARALARAAASNNRPPTPAATLLDLIPRSTSRRRSSGSRPRRTSGSRASSNHSIGHSSNESNPRPRASRSRRRTVAAPTASLLAGTATKSGVPIKPKTAKKRSRSKSHVSFMLPESSIRNVMTNDKKLLKILSYLNWNELNAVRAVNKQWMKLIGQDPRLQDSSGVISIGKNLAEAFKVFNNSEVPWTQFRITVNTVFDLTQPEQSQFWWKHGPTMRYLEIKNSSMTLSSLVEILSRATNLVHFSVTWTAEMYSFNSELIRKYYGIHFRNGTFSKMESLTIERSSFLTDNALWSILKWCGSCLHSLTLSCGPEERDDNLSRLKPRWTMEPIESFANRFGYSGNFKFLDFSGSNLVPPDLVRLAEMEKLTHLTGIRLSRCKISDEATLIFLSRKGAKLEELHLDFTPITDNVFNFKENKDLKLTKLRILNISGTQNFRNFGFLPDLVGLEEFHCSNTPWLTTNMITRPLEQHNLVKQLRKLDLSSNEKLSTKNVDLSLCHIWFIHFTTVVSKLTELNLSLWTQFGNDTNFKSICNNIPQLRKLRVREWTQLTDEGVTGITYEELAEFEDLRKDIWRSVESHTKTKPLIGKLSHLEVLDLGRCVNLTDMSLQFGILFLPNLRSLNMNGSQVSDAGIHCLIAKTKTLDKVSLIGCERVTPKGRKVHRLDGRSVFFGPV